MKKFPIKLIGDLIAVKMEEAKFGGLLLPEWQKSSKGTVVAKGPDAREVQIGDVVAFGAASGMDYVYDGSPMRIMREEKDVLCVY